MDRARIAKTREENEVEFSRIVAFSDGVFSIAITLLVLNLSLDHADLVTNHEVWEALGDQWENFLSYAISFAVIARFWLIHHRFFGEVKAFDGRLIGLNMLYLGLIVLIPFSSEVLGEYGGRTPSLVLYAVNLSAVVLVGLLMTEDARRAGLTTIDEQGRREGLARSTFTAAVFIASIPVAFIDPHIAPFLWLALFFDPSRLVGGEPDEPEPFG